NCGTCGYVCGNQHGAPTCGDLPDAGADAGAPQCQFACTAPYAHCATSADKNGCDVDTDTDNNNCGTCGNVCSVGQHCVSGTCACDATSCTTGCCDTNANCVT